MSRVKNVNGTSQNICRCGSWKNHWKKFSNKTASYCSVYGCSESSDLVGAHVQKTTSDMSWYIVPLCKTHNKATGELEIGSTALISANVQETCG